MSTATPTRNVRVTVEGTARAVKHDSRYLYVQHGQHSFLLNAEAEGVTVEDIVPEHAWTDGDVVQHPEALWTLTRIRGQWVSSNPATPSGHWSDKSVSAHIGPRGEAPGWGGPLQVLKCRAGVHQ